ncbi:hydroxysqualene dehydroxylase HpnE [Ectothiorhodospira lacustris]|uniref:hydroxysqualene dehydroxylase HpnE n=1 Tax=Ectothiorhodospira lacustris TaxID=2899127 RepID=UPI001EE783E4|nr:hydroxysqualene dehydroxylase HpnE [Ectothiorhodospira lacustris]MCG5510436.1 hydroxysqualene dehydroxylase HpnE [Ectothiorhodospira lacustris]MCG5522182.1 hydroxysqualene dehydroxylase HpnE [Ectothiorhodospira lacustris]
MNHPDTDICIVGAGWAGLSAAVQLAQAGRQVTVLEAARTLGGRARQVDLDGLPLDNGQHLLLGAYTHVLRMIETMGLQESRIFLRLPLDLSMRESGMPELSLSSLFLPAPFHLLAGLLTARGMPGKDRLQALPGLARLMRWKGPEDMPVSRLLHEHKQPDTLIRQLWIPLCLATLNTHPAEASARLFTAVLQGTFSGHRSHADLLIPKVSLSEVLPEPARRHLESLGGAVITGARVQAVQRDGHGFRLQLREGEAYRCRQVILATPHGIAAQLLTDFPALAETAANLEALPCEPICTVYLRYPEDTRLSTPFHGMLGTTGQWVFDRRFTGQPGVMAVVISASGPHMDLDNQALAAQIQAELHMLFPAWPTPLQHWVIREKQATFKAAVNCDQLRPGNRTAETGLWLAGDYTANGLPATLEGAIISGLECAESLLQSNDSTTEYP